ncbi:rod shape-determining protein MreC [Streptococcus suis]|nr:rod shape-determining protein MreC [Streptococcus suis]
MNKLSKLIVAISIFLLISFSLLFVTFSKGIQFTGVTHVVNSIVTPIQSVLSIPTRFLSEKKVVISDLIHTYEENKELKSSIIDLEDKVIEHDTLKKENESLRNSLSIMSTFPEKNFIPGFVLVRNPNSWYESIMIDIGKNDGVVQNALVLANGGLIGTVDALDEDSSMVKLFTNADDFTKLPVKIFSESNDIYGILTGYDSETNSFIINQLNSTNEIAIGSNVVTSDLAGTTPSNIQIGKVMSVQSDSNNLNRQLRVEPAANFSNIYSILVVGISNE